MHIEFDPFKNAVNIENRELSFECVGDFDFSTAVIGEDTRKAYPELRLVAVDFLRQRLHMLCFTPLPTGIRVISFRKANQQEVASYECTRFTY